MAEADDSPAAPPRRTLAAIVFSDVADFSARTQTDEDGTLALVRRDLGLIEGVCRKSGGRVLKNTGDGLLMFFDSAVQAVACALEVQQALARQAGDLPGEGVLMHRIGIHLGDVFLTETDVMGDGVNIAARLQHQADPGGICISQTVYDVVKNRLAIQATYLGPCELKNIREAVPVYQILLDASGTARPRTGPLSRGAWVWVATAGLGGLAVLVVLVFLIYRSVMRASHQAPVLAGIQAVPTGSTSRAVMPGRGQDDASPEQPTDATDPDVQAARWQFLNRYNFAGMLRFLESRGFQDTATYQRYQRLNRLKLWVQIQLRLTSASDPLSGVCPTDRGPQRYDFWQAPDGRIVVRGPDGESTGDLDDLSAGLFLALVRAALDRQPQGLSRTGLEHNRAAGELLEEARLCGLAPERGP